MKLNRIVRMATTGTVAALLAACGGGGSGGGGALSLQLAVRTASLDPPMGHSTMNTTTP